MKTLIAREYQKEQIYHDLACKTGFVTDVQILSIPNLLHVDAKEDKNATQLEFSHLLEQHKNEFPIYRDMFSFPAFIEEILKFARTCSLYAIQATDLPVRTESEQELKQILNYAFSLNLEEKERYASRDALLKKASALPELSFYESFEPDPFNQQFLEDLRHACPNAPLIEHPTTPKKTSLRYAMSIRQEIEACAQDLIEKNVPCNIVLSDYSNTLPVVNQVFTRYGIPFAAISQPLSRNVPYIYAALCEFGLHQTPESFVNALQEGAFTTGDVEQLIAWFQRCCTSVEEPASISSQLSDEQFPHLSKRVATLEEQTKQLLSFSEDDRQRLCASKNPQEVLQNAYTILQKSPYLKDPAELKLALRIRQVLNRSLPFIENEKDAEFLLGTILSLKVQAEGFLSSFCTVTDLTHPLPARTTTYVLGCNATNYPGIPQCKGLFDESYVAQIPAYPSLQMRHDSFLKGIEWIQTSGEEIIYSYATNDYQGRGIQPAFSIVTRTEAEVPWVLKTVAPDPQPVHSLEPELAKQLFTSEDGAIHSSISAIERWFSCPYSYFLQSGLKLREDRLDDLDAATIGSIQHAILKSLVEQYGKDYASKGEKEVDAFLEPYFEQLDLLYPKDKVFHALSKERLSSSMKAALHQLARLEESTIFKPVAAEKRFDFEILPGLSIHGIIDRVDEVNGTFRILDYKSSTHRLSESQMKTGTLLQLITYAIAQRADRGFKPAGTYYFSLQEENSNEKAGNGATTSFSENEEVGNEETLANTMEKSRRLNGWAYEVMDDSEEEYNRFFTPSKIYSFEQVETCIQLLYERFAEQLLNGTIPLDPKTGACTWCAYASICRNRSAQRAPVKLVLQDERFESVTVKSAKQEGE